MQMAYFREEMIQTRASLSKESPGFSFKYNARSGRYETPNEKDIHDTIGVPVDDDYKQVVFYPASDMRRQLRLKMRQQHPNMFYNTLNMVHDQSLTNERINTELTNMRNAQRARNGFEPFEYLHNNIDQNQFSDVCFER